MNNWAIVVGVDNYWKEEACLGGAVRDALQMRDWLLDPDGGAVPAPNLRLLLAPTDAGPSQPWDLATRGNLIGAIENVLDQSRGEGERFFFHFSGHGASARINFSQQSGIVPTDFRPHLPDTILTVMSLFELFQGVAFEEQFFFIDACRNLPFETEKRLGDYPNPREPLRPPKPQFVMYATQPGIPAIEIGDPGNEQGAFTEALLRGLQGGGAAKRWDGMAGEYCVRWDSLFGFVYRDVKARKLEAARLGQRIVIQQPQQYGEHAVENPFLGRFPELMFRNETLQVDLDPEAVVGIAEIVVRDMVTDEKRTPPLPALPVQFVLPQRTYSVRATAPGYKSKRPYVEVDLYGPERVRIELEQIPPANVAPPQRALLPAGVSAEPPPGTPSSGVRVSVVPGTGSIELRSYDQLAYLQLVSDSGTVLATGRSPLSKSPLEPGFYRARLVTPEGTSPEHALELAAGQSLLVYVDAVKPSGEVLDHILRSTRFLVAIDKSISLSEAIGPSSTVMLSTILATAAAAGLEPQVGYGQRLKKLEIAQPFDYESRAAGVHVVFGDEIPAPFWQEAECCLWSANEQQPDAGVSPVRHPTFPQIATLALPADPGAYWLWIRLTGGDLTLPVVVLPGRVSLIVCTRDEDSRMSLYQYSHALMEHPLGESRLLDPHFNEARFPAIRRIELMQRYVAAGQVMPTREDVDQLLLDKWTDPVAGCLGGYLLIRSGRTADLGVPARNLTRYFPDLPDGYVLMAIFEEEESDYLAPATYRRALETGLPVFRDGLVLLADAVNRFDWHDELSERVRNVLATVPAGSLWSMSPEMPGEVQTRLTPTPTLAFA